MAFFLGCENDGMSTATICSPGMYRSIEYDDNGNEVDGQPCRACPQGTWSKNWELREVGECVERSVVRHTIIDGCCFAHLTTPCR